MQFCDPRTLVPIALLACAAFLAGGVGRAEACRHGTAARTPSPVARTLAANRDPDPDRTDDARAEDTTLPPRFPVYVGPDGVLNHPAPGSVEKILPTVNSYTRSDGGYVAVYTRDPRHAIYSVGDGIYVVGQIRMRGHYAGRIFQPAGYENEDISRVPELRRFANDVFPGNRGGAWLGGDTGGWFGLDGH